VLERILRDRENPATAATLDGVHRRIRDKTGWDPGGQPVDAGAFLNDYYAALRNHLEQHMLLGDRREDKHAMAKRRTRT